MRKKALYIIYGVLVSVFVGFLGSGVATADISGSASVNIHKEDALAITLSGDVTNGSASVNINVDNLNGVFNETGDITATVISTVANGYTLGMDSSTSALTSSGSEATIDELAESAEGYERASFPVNKWGYSLKTGNEYGNYFGMGDGVELQDVSEPTAGTISTLRLGTKVDSTIPDGRYSTTIVFTLTAKVESRLYMQDVTAATCPNERTLAYDLRDDNAYYIQEITTGETTLCWMTTNLDLAAETPLYSDTSNVPDGYPISGGVPFYTLAASTQDFTNPTIASVYNSGNTICDGEQPCYSYYDLVSASAGTRPYPANEDVVYDICPKGWRLPTQENFQALRDIYGTGEAITAAPWYGVYAGVYNTIYNNNNSARYWSSTAVGGSGFYILYYYPAYTHVTQDGAYFGFSVRCVAK